MEEEQQASAPSSGCASATTGGLLRGGKDNVEKSEFVVHTTHTCDRCFLKPIVGTRYHAGDDAPDFDLCEDCFGDYDDDHVFETRLLACDRQMKDGWALKLQVSQSGADDESRQIRRVKLGDLWDASNSQLSHSKLVSLAVGFAFPVEVEVADLAQFDVETTYTDEDGDEITMTTDAELGDAFRQTLKGAVPRLLRISAKANTKRTSATPLTEDAAPEILTPTPPAAGFDFGTDPNLPIWATQIHAFLHTLIGVIFAIVAVLWGASKGARNCNFTPGPTNMSKSNSRGIPDTTNVNVTTERFLLDILAKMTSRLGNVNSSAAERVSPANNSSSSEDEKTADPEVETPHVRPFIHARHTCDGCSKTPIVGTRYRAKNIPDFDLCSDCVKNFEGYGTNFEPEELARDRERQHKWRVDRQWRKGCNYFNGEIRSDLRASTRAERMNMWKNRIKDIIEITMSEAVKRQNHANEEETPYQKEEAADTKMPPPNVSAPTATTASTAGDNHDSENAVFSIAKEMEVDDRDQNFGRGRFNNQRGRRGGGHQGRVGHRCGGGEGGPYRYGRRGCRNNRGGREYKDHSTCEDDRSGRGRGYGEGGSNEGSSEKDTPVSTIDEKKPSGEIDRTQFASRRAGRMNMRNCHMKNIIEAAVMEAINRQNNVNEIKTPDQKEEATNAKISPPDISASTVTASTATNRDAEKYASKKDSSDKGTQISAIDEKSSISLATSGGDTKDLGVMIASAAVDAVSIANSLILGISDVLEKVEEGKNQPESTKDAISSAGHETPVKYVSTAKLWTSDVHSEIPCDTSLNSTEGDDVNKDKSVGKPDNEIQSEDGWSVVDDEENKVTNDETIARAAAITTIELDSFNSDTSAVAN